MIVEELTMENVGQQTILLEIGKSLHFGTGISTVKMVAKLEILSLYRAYFQENPYISHLIIKEVRKEVNTYIFFCIQTCVNYIPVNTIQLILHMY